MFSLDGAFAPVADLFNSVVFFSVRLGEVDVPLVVLWLGGGSIALTLALRFLNIRGFLHAWRILIKGAPVDHNTKGEISHFEALSAALSGTIGLGNIASVPIAIVLGGPGAIFWMLLAGFFAMSTKFAECTLAVKYRKVGADGQVSGGPMYYIEEAFSRLRLPALGKVLGVLFALMAVGASVSIFQINQAYAQFERVTAIEAPLLFGIVLSVLIAIIVLGGIRSIARVTSRLVPAMCVLYLGTGFFILAINADQIPAVFRQIFEGAFGLDAAAGGAVGAMINGLKRATYSSEAGTGSSAIAHSAVRTNNPLTEGYVALVEPFIDTIVVCLTTGLIILVTGTWQSDVPMGIGMTSLAFESVFPWFSYILCASVILFAFSTAVSWAYYGSKAVGFLSGGNARVDVVYKLALCGVLSLGATVQLTHIVDFIDAMLFGMAIPNLIAVFILLPELRRDLAAYEKTIGK
ncbi:alanine:cation symporter family protein [Hyphomonas sp. WL0036]|uniref:alanine/glycine:cation symporter family protein n=1 Tax=Hyphomonas sediminis TaxID=2866160 RepID=UPI001C80DE85|nr:alanine/glycine:cation symporter family protein [Hyphomonas sediminis]MBY9068115.1 alanine:cation symporter family protein [Hyphomonas sediminis]